MNDSCCWLIRCLYCTNNVLTSMPQEKHDNLSLFDNLHCLRCPGETVVGRFSESSDITIPDCSSMSRKHLLICIRQNKTDFRVKSTETNCNDCSSTPQKQSISVVLRDLESSNGTFLDGCRIHGEVEYPLNKVLKGHEHLLGNSVLQSENHTINNKVNPEKVGRSMFVDASSLSCIKDLPIIMDNKNSHSHKEYETHIKANGKCPFLSSALEFGSSQDVYHIVNEDPTTTLPFNINVSSNKKQKLSVNNGSSPFSNKPVNCNSNVTYSQPKGLRSARMAGGHCQSINLNSSKRKLLWRGNHNDVTPISSISETPDSAVNITPDANTNTRANRFVRLLGHGKVKNLVTTSEEEKKRLDALIGVNRNVNKMQNELEAQFFQSARRGWGKKTGIGL